MKQIISLDNPLVKKAVQLATPKGRAQYNQFIAEGLRTCKTLTQTPLALDTFFVTPNTLEQARTFISEQYILVVSESVMNKIAATKTPSGFLGIFSLPRTPDSTTLKPGLVLFGISDPGNMGTLIRSAVAFDKPQLILVEGVDPWNPKVVQASAGTIGYASLIQLNWQQLLQHKNRPPLCALATHGGKNIDATIANDLLLVGSEAHGIAQEVLDQCAQRVSLPMPGPAESLNAAIAGSIALYLSSL